MRTTSMGKSAQTFTLNLRFFRSTNFFQFQLHAVLLFHIVLFLVGVTGTEFDLRHDVPQEEITLETLTKPQSVKLFTRHGIPHISILDGEDSHLPLPSSLLFPFQSSSRGINIKMNEPGTNDDEVMNGQNHILSRRRRRRSVYGHSRNKRQVQNSYEKFYLCMFTLFTNPNCRDQQHQDQMIDYGQNQQGHSLYQPDNNPAGYLSFVPTSPPNNNNNRNNNGGGFNLFGNGLFGSRFGFNQAPPSFTNAFTPFFTQQQHQYYPQPSTPNYDFYQPHNQQFPQTPYPEQQVNRRPGPPPPTITNRKTTTTTPVSTTLKTTTTGRSTIRTNRPINTIRTTPTPTTTRRYTTRRSSTTAAIRRSTSTPPNQIKVETVLSTTFPVPATPQEINNSLVDCENETDSQSLTTKKISFQLSPTPPSTVTSSNVISFSPIRPSISSPSYNPDYSSTNTIKTLANENSALKSDLDSLRSEVTNYQVQNKYLQDALSTLQSDNGQQKTRVRQLERTNEDLQKQNGQLQHVHGDMRTQLNEARSKVQYAEEKLVRLSRQSIEDQKQVTRLQNRVRDLNKENNECKSQVYQLQLRNTQRIVHESATSMEMEMKGSALDGKNKKGISSRFPQQVYRDDILFTSTEQQENSGSFSSIIPQIIEFDENEEERTTELSTQVEEELNEVEITTMPTLLPLQKDGDSDEPEITTIQTSIAPSTTPTPSTTTTTTTTPASSTISTSTTPLTTTSTTTSQPSTQVDLDSSPEDEEDVYLFPSLTSANFAQHPGIIFDENDFGPSQIVSQDDDDDSNEISILIGRPDEDPNSSSSSSSFIGSNGQSSYYSPANYDAFSSFSHHRSRGNTHNPFNNYWPYHQYSSSSSDKGVSSTKQ